MNHLTNRQNLMGSRGIIGLLLLGCVFASVAPSVVAQTCHWDTIPSSASSSDFTDNGNGTVTHRKTGLMWKRCAEGQSGTACTGVADYRSYNLITGYIFAGFSDWHLPSKAELASIVERACYDPAINLGVFPATPSLRFWTWSPGGYGSPNTWIDFLDGGDACRANYGGICDTGAFRLVRSGGQTPDSLAFLNVSKVGNGTVASNPSGIDCGGDCSENYTAGTTVTLVATPASGSSFGGWSGDCSGTGNCTLTMNAGKTVVANFAASEDHFVLSLSKVGNGSGTVTSNPSGIDCGGDCSENYAVGTTVTLVATPAGGFSFGGWSGDCSGTGNCALTMNAGRTVVANFGVSSPTSPPHPDIKVNDQDGPLTVSENTLITLKLTLDPGKLTGQSVDAWVRADTPFGTYYFSYGNSWQTGLQFPFRFPGGTLTALSGQVILSDYRIPAG
ncbi:MAG: DUF1566 domain-containing protein, partial [Pseudomonadota bacterium]